jgi:hypothetical protein
MEISAADGRSKEAIQSMKYLTLQKISILVMSKTYIMSIGFLMSRDKNLVPLTQRTRTMCHFGLDSYLNIIMTGIVRWNKDLNVSIGKNSVKVFDKKPTAKDLRTSCT